MTWRPDSKVMLNCNTVGYLLNTSPKTNIFLWLPSGKSHENDGKFPLKLNYNITIKFEFLWDFYVFMRLLAWNIRNIGLYYKTHVTDVHDIIIWQCHNDLTHVTWCYHGHRLRHFNSRWHQSSIHSLDSFEYSNLSLCAQQSFNVYKYTVIKLIN